MRHGYEASKVDSLKPRKYIHLGLVDWKLAKMAGGSHSRPHVEYRGTSLIRNRPPLRTLQKAYAYGGPRGGGVFL